MDDDKNGTNRISTSVASFDRDFLNPATPISCIGDGSYGGKARGLVFIREVLSAGLNTRDFGGITLDIPSLVIVGTSVFDAYLERNRLVELAESDAPDAHIARAFQRADLPIEVLGDLRALIEQVHTPLAVRSSSLLEDTRHEPFAGVYATKMIPNNQYDPDIRFRQLVEAIKFVYASTFFRTAKDYRRAMGHPGSEEKMAVIIQQIVGRRYHNRFYPELAGVARSYNYYPMKPARPEDGVVYLALGLGRTIVEGGPTWAYSPTYPKVEPPFLSVQRKIKDTQNEFWMVNMGEPPEYNPTQETEYLQRENLLAAEKDGSLRYLASTYEPLSGRLSIGTGFNGPRVLTFAPLLVLKELPLNDLVVSLLSICENALHEPVEIEFAMTFNPHYFGFLQVRSMVAPEGEVDVSETELKGEQVLLASEHVLGNGSLESIQDIVYVKPETFTLQHTRAIAPEVEAFNRKLIAQNCPYLLVVFGRLGTTDHWLGIPVNWGQVSGAKAIVEATQENVRVELSQGSHYFHNLVNLGVFYFTLPFTNPYAIDWDWLNRQEIVEETQYIRHVHLRHPLKIKVDGRHSRGVILKG
ncbi:MAG TPA: PEP/pyruvate-binding domain-containing protein [Anaerolineales bacterium]|nr:PEP/pyruvate-binding domain-containing protein [Anaerolineales bacterium]